MPTLPLNHPEPWAITLGTMLYPGADEDNRRKARALAAHYLAEPVRQFLEADHPLSRSTLESLVTDGGLGPTDYHGRWTVGEVVGELVKAHFLLAADKPQLASWENSIKIWSVVARPDEARSRSQIKKHLSTFSSVLHLWGAFAFRGRQIKRGHHDGFDEYVGFLIEAEILRHWGQNWRPKRATAKTPFVSEMYQVPETWQRHIVWPERSPFEGLVLPEEALATLKPAGRPRKQTDG